MTVELIEGWDTYPTGGPSTSLVGSEWITTSFGGSVSASQFSNGRCSLNWNTSSNVQFYRTASDSDDYCVGYRYLFASMASSNENMGFGLGGAIARLYLGLDTTGHVVLRRGGVTLWTSTFTVPISTWIYLDFVYNRAAGTCDIYVSNNFITQVTGIVSIGVIDRVEVGALGGSGAGSNLYFDDLIAKSDNVRWGETGVILLSPDTDQPGNDWTITGAANGYQVLDNAPPVTGQYIEAVNVGDISDFALPTLPVGVFEVFALKNYYRATKSTSGTADVRSRLTAGAVTTNGVTNSVAQTTYTSYYDLYETNPDTGLQFVPSDFNADNIKIGYERTA